MNDMPRNRFRAGLETGETQYGVWLGLPDPSAAEIMAGAGFDWLLIDSVSIYLYLDRALYLTALLFLVYIVIAVFGYQQWRQHYRAQSS